MAIALAAAVLLVSGNAYAQQSTTARLVYPASEDSGAGKQTAYHNEYDYDDLDYYAFDQDEPAPSDVPAPSDNGCCQPCDTCCNARHKCCCEPEPCKLFDCCALDRMGLEIAGWISQSIFLGGVDPQDKFNGPVTFNDRSGEYQLNQFYFHMGREVDTGGNGGDLGGRIDLLYGSDWRFTPAAGLENNMDGTPNWNQDHRFYGLAMPQLYGEVGCNDLSVKIGRFYTIIGYEVVTAPDNFFSTHAYTMQYAEPFTHTGALASLSLSDSLEVTSGIHRGWDQWEDFDNNIGYLGGFTWTPYENVSLAWACTWSDEPDYSGLVTADRFMYSLVVILGLSENLTYVFQHDLGEQNNGVAAGVDGEWYGINQYLLYDVTDQCSLGIRGEWFRDDDGTRVAGLGTPPGSTVGARGWGGSGFAGDFYEIALGLNLKLCPNLTLRNELRWDWYDGPVGQGGQLPYDFGQKNTQFLLGTNAIVTY